MTGLPPLVLVLALLGADDEAVKSDTDKIQGSWILASTESDGETVPADSLKAKEVRMIYEGNQILAKMGPMTVSLGTFALDSTKTPKTYDRTYPDGSPRRGIYKLEEDTLTVCIAPLRKERPKAFATRRGDGLTLLVYKREKP